MAERDAAEIILQHLWVIPIFAVFVVGIVVAVVNWGTHPKPAAFAFIGFSVLLVNLILGTAFNIWLFEYDGRESFENLENVLRVMSIIRSVVSAGGFALLVSAIFSGRSRPVLPQPEPGKPPFIR